METEQYVTIIHYLALFLILGAIAEIYVRKKGLGVRADRMRDGQMVTNKQSIVPPIGLLIVSIVIAILTRHAA